MSSTSARPSDGDALSVWTVSELPPPEDIGGTPGFQHFLRVMRDPHHPEHGEMVAWVGGRFDPDAFELTAVNRKLARLR
jgi:Plasmid pRiA4b ORF-3-like protein